MSSSLHTAIKTKLANGYVEGRSGQIAILLYPNWINGSYTAATHGSPYNHDTHVPFLLYGMNISPQSSTIRYNITDIAPTISYLLGISQPNACIGNPISEVFKSVPSK